MLTFLLLVFQWLHFRNRVLIFLILVPLLVWSLVYSMVILLKIFQFHESKNRSHNYSVFVPMLKPTCLMCWGAIFCVFPDSQQIPRGYLSCITLKSIYYKPTSHLQNHAEISMVLILVSVPSNSLPIYILILAWSLQQARPPLPIYLISKKNILPYYNNVHWCC